VVAGSSVLLDKHPQVKGCVRGEVQSSGYICIPNADNKTCKLTYLVQVDPKGWLPVWLVNLVAADQAMNVLRLKILFESENKTSKSKKKNTKRRQKQKEKKKKEKEEQQKEEKKE